MDKLLIAAVAGCTALAMPVFALSQASAKGASPPAMEATMMCRHAMPNEKATAMTAAGDAPMVCKTMDPAAMMHRKGGPNITKAMTPGQVDAAWRAYISSMLIVPGGTGGG